ncbi:MAG TPA: hypothetical protein ENG83_07250 [Nitrospirae bacterium]|nr:hypothetical protein [Nitrospirota bacterium]
MLVLERTASSRENREKTLSLKDQNILLRFSKCCRKIKYENRCHPQMAVNPIKMPDSLSGFYDKIAEIHLRLSSLKVELIVVTQLVI